MITLITGTPGSGKTLWTITELSKEKERPIFYMQINGLALDWSPIERVEQIHECPPNAIIVIDECQTLFPVRSHGAQVPEYISKFETHRHRGHDFFLITQHPMLIDHHLRRLVGQHKHLNRGLGQAKFANVYEKNGLIDTTKLYLPELTKSVFRFPKSSYELYKSAEIHTKTTKLPKRLLLLPALIILIGLLFWGGYARLKGTTKPIKESAQLYENAANFKPSKKLIDFLKWWDPRSEYVEYLPDPVVKDIPKIAACISSRAQCRCYTQQGINIATDEQICRHLSAHSYHDIYASAYYEEKNMNER